MKNGFTLIELLVVILIVGILAAIALPQYQAAILKARWMGILTTSRALLTAQQSYYLANGSYADDLTALDVQLPDGGTYLNDGGLANSTIRYPNGDYYRNTGSSFIDRWGSGFLWAKAGLSTSVHLLISYPSAKIECRANGSSKTDTQVCLSMGGVIKGDCDEGGDCKAYVIN